MLTYAFDLLYAIYEEEGYDATEIPALILTHNLTGVEIDNRAGALAAFALAMKAAAKLGRRRFLRMEAKPDICVLQNVAFTEAEMQDVAAVVGKDLFTNELRETLGQFEQAKNFGSLIVPKLHDPAETLQVLEARDFGGDLLLKDLQERVIAVLRMAEALSPNYHVVVANPPYMGGKGMNGGLGGWLKSQFPNSNSDLFSAFMDRILDSLPRGGFAGLMTPFTWMFLSSFTALRDKLTSEFVLSSLVRPEYHSFFDSAYVPICAFTIEAKADAGLQEHLLTFKTSTARRFSQSRPSKQSRAQAHRGDIRQRRRTSDASQANQLPIGCRIIFVALLRLCHHFVKLQLHVLALQLAIIQDFSDSGSRFLLSQLRSTANLTKKAYTGAKGGIHVTVVETSENGSETMKSS